MKPMTPRLLIMVAVLVAAPVSALTSFKVIINGAQANAGAGTGSAATGSATLALNASGNTLTYSITLVGVDLDGAQTPADSTDDVTAMHFHNAPPGANGGVVFGLISPNHDADDLVINPVAGTLKGAWENTDVNPLSGQLANLDAGNLYLNVHTTSFSGGEIRGQVLPLVDGISAEALRWRSRDTPPFNCAADFVGYVYLQRDVSNFSTASHLLCFCAGVDSGAITYEWRTFDGSVDCADLL